MFEHKKIIINGKEYYQTIYINKDGSKYYYLNGKVHREDGPAIEYVDGTKYWYKNSKLHREDGPAVEHANGNKSWWLNGKRHRKDGLSGGTIRK